MNTELKNYLDNLESLEKQATPGPYDYYWGWNLVFTKSTPKVIIADYFNLHLESRAPEQIKNDMAFHAASRNALPKLLAMLRVAVNTLERISCGQAKYYGSEAANALVAITDLAKQQNA